MRAIVAKKNLLSIQRQNNEQKKVTYESNACWVLYHCGHAAASKWNQIYAPTVREVPNET